MSGDVTHSLGFRGGDSQIVAFDVPSSFVDDIQDSAIDQRRPSGM